MPDEPTETNKEVLWHIRIPLEVERAAPLPEGTGSSHPAMTIDVIAPTADEAIRRLKASLTEHLPPCCPHCGETRFRINTTALVDKGAKVEVTAECLSCGKTFSRTLAGPTAP